MMGERFRKATPKELRWYSGAFAFIPVWMALSVRIESSYFDHASGFGIWLFMMGCFVVGFLWLAAWVRFVSSDVSWWVGGIVWVIALYLAITGRL